MLYGIDMAKAAIVKKRQVVIVEGYTDVMAMHLAGVDTAIATCGTAFGAEHAKIVRRLIADDSLGAVQLIGPLKVDGQQLSSRIVFTFDGDAAGQKAAIHASDWMPRFRRRRSSPWPMTISIRAICASNVAMRRFARLLRTPSLCMIS